MHSKRSFAVSFLQTLQRCRQGCAHVSTVSLSLEGLKGSQMAGFQDLAQSRIPLVTRTAGRDSPDPQVSGSVVCIRGFSQCWSCHACSFALLCSQSVHPSHSHVRHRASHFSSGKLLRSKVTTWVTPGADGGIECYSDKAAAVAGRGKAAVPICPRLTSSRPHGVGALDQWKEGSGSGLGIQPGIQGHLGIRLGSHGGVTLMHTCLGCRHSTAQNFVAVRKPDAAQELPVHALHSASTTEFEYDSDLTLPGLWHSSSGALLLPPRLHPTPSINLKSLVEHSCQWVEP